jgi:hypothetical protein
MVALVADGRVGRSGFDDVRFSDRGGRGCTGASHNRHAIASRASTLAAGTCPRTIDGSHG